MTPPERGFSDEDIHHFKISADLYRDISPSDVRALLYRLDCAEKVIYYWDQWNKSEGDASESRLLKASTEAWLASKGSAGGGE